MAGAFSVERLYPPNTLMSDCEHLPQLPLAFLSGGRNSGGGGLDYLFSESPTCNSERERVSCLSPYSLEVRWSLEY